MESKVAVKTSIPHKNNIAISIVYTLQKKNSKNKLNKKK